MARKLRQEVFGLFTGIMFEIRRVPPGDYLREIKDLPFSIAPGTQEELDKLSDKIEAMPRDKQDDLNNKTRVLFLSKGIARMKYPDEDWRQPNIWFGTDAECPEDSVTIADLGGDADLVAGEIAKLTFNLQGAKALSGFFRGEQQQPAGPSGEEIRSEAVEPTAA